jgi:transposase
LGFSYKKPKLIPSNVDLQSQDDFIRHFEYFLKKKSPKDVVIFYDSSHPQYQSINDYGWFKRGRDVFLLNHGMRGHINISGGVDIDTGKVIVDYPDKVNSESTLAMLKNIEGHYPGANTINVVLDNASAHKSAHVKHSLEGSKINLVYLPPYSPNLNFMERIWGLLRRKVLTNEFSETFYVFKEKVKKFFKKTIPKKTMDWVLPLLTDEFQCYDEKIIT